MSHFARDTADAIRSRLEEGMPRYLDILREMVGINSHTLNPRGVDRLGDFTADLFRDMGFTAERIPSVNPRYGRHLLLHRPGTSKRAVACVSHLDTVFSPEEEERHDFRWRVEGDRAYGPGTADIKGGTLVMLMMLEALKGEAPAVFDAVSWELLFDASEERESDDFGALCAERMAPAGDDGALACLVFEAGTARGSGQNLVTSRKGRAEFRFRVEGRGGHSGVAHRRGASAIRQMAELIIRLEKMTDYGAGLTVNVGSVSGGTEINRVPHHAEARAEMRAFDPGVFEKAVADIMALGGLSTVRSADGAFSCRTHADLVRRVPAWPENPGTMGLFDQWQRAARLLGGEARPEMRGGLSDGNFTWNVMPTIDGLGPSGGNPHCSESDPDAGKEQEYAVISSFIPKAVLNTMALVALVEDKGLL